MINLLKIAFAAFLSSAAMSANAAYIFTDLGTLGGSYSVARGINNAGQVVGEAFTSDNFYHATIWNDTVASDLTPNNGGWNSYAEGGINDAGQVSGQSVEKLGDFDWRWRSSVWHGTTPTLLDTLPGTAHSDARDINNADQVVGRSIINVQGPGGVSGHYQATLWNGTSATTLGTLGGTESFAYRINDSGQIIGASQDASGVSHSTLWSGSQVINLDMLTGVSFGAIDINNSGQIVGNVPLSGSPGVRAAIWDGLGLTDLGTLGGTESQAFRINNIGQIIGMSTIAGNIESHAFLWDNGNIADLSNEVGSGWVINNLTGINDNGWIVGNASNSALGITSHAFLLTPVPVPEPDTYAMLLEGLGLIGLMARRRKTTQTQSSM